MNEPALKNADSHRASVSGSLALSVALRRNGALSLIADQGVVTRLTQFPVISDVQPEAHGHKEVADAHACGHSDATFHCEETFLLLVTNVEQA